MSRDVLPELLQECLAAYDAGLSPEDCLTAYPTHRAELEPLLRQALTLRVAFAPGATEAFRKRAKHSLMFAAGREVSQALAAAPDPKFVAQARSRFMQAAGSTAQRALGSVPAPDPRYVASARERFIAAAGAREQEALRAVPPPRLPFWWNTRRRLIEAASAHRQPIRRPFGGLAFQAGLSAAVLVVAVAVAGFAFLVDRGAQPSAASEVAILERQLNEIEARYNAGEPVVAAEVTNLSKRTLELAEKLNEQPAAFGAEKLPALIERQRAVVDKVYANTSPPPEVAQTQQQLDDQRTRLLAAAQANPASTSTALPATSTPAGPTATATITPVPQPLQAGQIRYGLLPGDSFGGLTWQEVRTISMRFVVPSGWQIRGAAPDASGVARLVSNPIGVEGDGVTLLINVQTGEIFGLIASQPMILRSETGVYISPLDLVEKAGASAAIVRHILDSFQLTPAPIVPPVPAPPTVALPASTATSTATATPSPTAPTPTATPTPVPASPTTSAPGPTRTP